MGRRGHQNVKPAKSASPGGATGQRRPAGETPWGWTWLGPRPPPCPTASWVLPQGGHHVSLRAEEDLGATSGWRPSASPAPLRQAVGPLLKGHLSGTTPGLPCLAGKDILQEQHPTGLSVADPHYLVHERCLSNAVQRQTRVLGRRRWRTTALRYLKLFFSLCHFQGFKS